MLASRNVALLRPFAGIDGETFRVEPIVHLAEVVARVIRVQVAGQNAREYSLGQQPAKPQLNHAAVQGRPVGHVPRMALFATFGKVLGERLVQRIDDLHRGRELHLPFRLEEAVVARQAQVERAPGTGCMRSRRERLQITKASPAMPWMHLFELDTRKSAPMRSMSIGMPA